MKFRDFYESLSIVYCVFLGKQFSLIGTQNLNLKFSQITAPTLLPVPLVQGCSEKEPTQKKYFQDIFSLPSQILSLKQLIHGHIVFLKKCF